MSTAADRDGWRKYLLLDELTQWAQPPSETPEHRVGEPEPSWPRNLLSRVYWPRLQADQQEFLQADAVGQLMDCLAAWSRDPVDYRQLLVGLEQIEQDARSRQVLSWPSRFRYCATPGPLANANWPRPSIRIIATPICG